jgi:hypothetical protein
MSSPNTPFTSLCCLITGSPLNLSVVIDTAYILPHPPLISWTYQFLLSALVLSVSNSKLPLSSEPGHISKHRTSNSVGFKASLSLSKIALSLSSRKSGASGRAGFATGDSAAEEEYKRRAAWEIGEETKALNGLSGALCTTTGVPKEPLLELYCLGRDVVGHVLGVRIRAGLPDPKLRDWVLWAEVEREKKRQALEGAIGGACVANRDLGRVIVAGPMLSPLT